MEDFWSQVTEFVNSDVGKWLPVSPVQRYVVNWDGVDIIQSYLPYVNWFLPISIIIDITAIWLSAIAVFYMSQAALRWFRIIG